MNHLDNLKNAIYINLESRKDRRQHVESQLTALKTGMPNLVAERFNAIKHVTNGAIGCSMSHLRCIQIAKERGRGDLTPQVGKVYHGASCQGGILPKKRRECQARHGRIC